MSWLEKLYNTYEKNSGLIGKVIRKGDTPLLPVCHTTQQAHITIVLDIEGNILRAYVVQKSDARTIIPSTEESAGRTSGAVAHPLCDKLQYVAADYRQFGGEKGPCYAMYLVQIEKWAHADAGNQKLQAVCTYVKKGRVVQDLIEKNILYCDVHTQLLLNQWNAPTETPEIFKLLAGGVDTHGKNKPWQADAFIRFAVQQPNDPQSDLWTDSKIWESWIQYYKAQRSLKGLCLVSGKQEYLAEQHPAKVRNDGDKAKIVSSNDTSGFTFRGRFTSANEACGIGFEVTQKAHSALRWLIAKQGRRDDGQAIVAWAVSGVDIPDPFVDSLSMLFTGGDVSIKSGGQYTAQEVGLALRKLIGGYAAKLGSVDDVVIVGLDSATPGRMALKFYRELKGFDFLNRVQSWHDEKKGCVWLLDFGQNKKFVGAPAPRDIAEGAYGRGIDGKLRTTTVERLLPCIIDAVPIPQDLIESCVLRASRRHSLERWDWEKTLGIACALYQYQHKERNYLMSLERDRKSRDYLYGRLLAAADGLEGLALSVAKENRSTNATRLMQRFGDRPCSTWRTIELALVPYKARLGNRANKYSKELDEIMSLFTADDFVKDVPLSGEFLIGFHAQRAAFWEQVEQIGDERNNVDDESK